MSPYVEQLLELVQIMCNLAVQGITLVFMTHDPNLAAGIAGQAVLMHQGQILAAGPASSVLTAENLAATYGGPVQGSILTEGASFCYHDSPQGLVGS